MKVSIVCACGASQAEGAACPIQDSNRVDGSHVTAKQFSYRTTIHPYRSCNDMSYRESFSEFRKKAKKKLSKIGDRRDGRLTADVGSERLDHSSLPLQSDKSDWKHITSSAAKLFLRSVKEASDAFPPLKSVAGGLCAILDNCEVRSTFVRSICDAHSSRSKRWSTNRR